MMNTKPLAFMLALGLCSSASATLITYDYDFQAVKSGTTGPSYVGNGRLTVDTAYFAITDLNLTTDAFTYEWSGIGYSIADIDRIVNGHVLGSVFSFAGDDVQYFNFDYFTWPSGESPLAYLDRVEEEYNFLDLPNGDTYLFYGKYRLAEVPEPSTLALLGLGLVGFAIKRRTSSRRPQC